MQTTLSEAQALMLSRIEATSAARLNGLPHWADPATGEWTTTPDGDWTGGAHVGQLWLAHIIDAERFPLSDVYRALSFMEPRIERKTAFKGFGFYYGAAIGDILVGDPKARETALRVAHSLVSMFDEKLGLIPLGSEAEEADAIGSAESSIDSLQASGLLFWAASELGDERMEDVAVRHTKRVLEIHVRPDGSVVQSSTLDRETGEVLRTHTHKGYNDTSTWGRAQGWAMIYSAYAWVVRPDELLWREYATRTADWWIANVPDDKVSFWDFSDPDIPNTSRDTAATAMAAAAMLRLDSALGGGTRYAAAAADTVTALVEGYLTPAEGHTPPGILTGGCFTRSSTVRSHDAADNVELVFGSYYLFESLCVLDGTIPAGRI
jgi:unsaturated chondroitin disaccharide hydrolase